jgi:hypothetical protein
MGRRSPAAATARVRSARLDMGGRVVAGIDVGQEAHGLRDDDHDDGSSDQEMERMGSKKATQ